MPVADRYRYDLHSVNPLRPRLLSTTPAHRARVGHLRLAGATASGLALVAFAIFAADPAAARSAQDPGAATTVTAPGTPGSDPTGPATTVAAGGPASTAATATSTTQPTNGAGSRRAADENRRIWVVVAGLIAVAVGLSLLTIRYWRQTKPVPLAPVPASGADAASRERRNRRAEGGRHSRRAVAGADHVSVDDGWEPRGTGEHDRVEIPTTDRRPRPTPEQRAAAYQTAGRRS